MLLALLTILTTFIDISWRPLFYIRGIAPDVLLVWVVGLAILCPRKSLQLAFMAGLLKDFLSGGLLGVHTSALLVIVGLVLILKDRLFQNKLLTLMVLLAVVTFVHSCLSSWSLHVRIGFARVVYNLMIFPIMWAALSRFNKDTKGVGML